jgi:hypothetical protein
VKQALVYTAKITQVQGDDEVGFGHVTASGWASLTGEVWGALKPSQFTEDAVAIKIEVSWGPKPKPGLQAP